MMTDACTAHGHHPNQVRKNAPLDWTLPMVGKNAKGEIEVNTVWGGRRGKPTVLVVVPAAFTPVCSATLKAFSERRKEVGAGVFGLCADYSASIEEWIQRDGFTLPIFSDFADRQVVQMLSGVEADGRPVRATFLFDDKDQLVWQVSTEDAEYHVDAAIAAIAHFCPTEAPVRNDVASVTR